MKKITLSVIALTISAMITGCSTLGEQYQANVYTAGQVNSRQAAKTVKILAVLPARIEVDNTEGKQNAQMIGVYSVPLPAEFSATRPRTTPALVLPWAQSPVRVWAQLAAH